ncbi:hypothetical protein SNE40_022735 [Patella caerulea]|uniref:Reverse transcriptase domain-containing protein n=1 Tax=Patella caerulea TaxID=87958 RepID=A0AAN8GGG2_PATCE
MLRSSRKRSAVTSKVQRSQQGIGAVPPKRPRTKQSKATKTSQQKQSTPPTSTADDNSNIPTLENLIEPDGVLTPIVETTTPTGNVYISSNYPLEKLIGEVNAGRMIGPFRSRPLFSLQISPIGLVPKNSGGWRLITHLSYPHGNSINDFIDENNSSVKYTSFDSVVQMIASLGENALLGKMDIKSAFRLLPVHPGDFDLLGIYFNNYYFIDKCLPMGCAVSCSLFETFSRFLQWVVTSKSELHTIEHYLDDFIFAGASNSSDCLSLMKAFTDVCESLGVPIADDKTVGPTNQLTFLGLSIDTKNMQIKIPIDKLARLNRELKDIVIKRRVRLHELESITGLMSFCAKAIPCSRAFLRRFYDIIALFKSKNPKYFYTVRVTRNLKEDILVWLTFLDSFNGVCYISDQRWLSNTYLQLFTDSSGNSDLGCGAYFCGHWLQFRWPKKWANQDIMRDMTSLELIPIVFAFITWSSYLQNKCVVLHVDNQALVSVINKQSSKSARVMSLLRPLVLQFLLYNIRVKAVYITSVKNDLADSLSRFQEQRFRALAPSAEKMPDSIPVSFLEIISRMALKN